MKFSKSILAIATMTISAATLATPYPYHGGNYSYNASDDDVVTTTVTKMKSQYQSDDDVTTTTSSYQYSDDDTKTINKSDDDVTTTTSNYSYSDDDVKTINKSDDDVTTTTSNFSYSDDDVTKINKEYRSHWESNYTSNWSNQEDRLNSSANANDQVHQESGHKANGSVKVKATGHSNATRGSSMFMSFGGMGNPVSNSGVYIDNTDNNNNQFGINSNQSSVQTGGDLGDRVISLSGIGNTDGSANGSVGTYGANDIGQFGNTGLNNRKAVSSSVSK